MVKEPEIIDLPIALFTVSDGESVEDFLQAFMGTGATAHGDMPDDADVESTVFVKFA